MNKIVKRLYQIPLVKVVSFKVEEGFAGTTRQNLRVGNPIPSDEDHPVKQGTEAFEFTYF